MDPAIASEPHIYHGRSESIRIRASARRTPINMRGCRATPSSSPSPWETCCERAARRRRPPSSVATLQGVTTNSSTKMREIVYTIHVSLLLLTNLAQAFSWTTLVTVFGMKCRSDTDCMMTETDLICSSNEPRICRCRRKLEWDTISKRCFFMEEESYSTKFDVWKDLVMPGVIVLSCCGLVYFCFRVFCNCGKLYMRRRRRLDLPRELEEIHSQQQLQQQYPQLQHQQQPTWVASYRVFGPVSGAGGQDPRSPSGFLSPTGPPGFSMHPTPCMGLFLPSSHLASASPPPYEEALKHKVILSSYPGVVGSPNPPEHPDGNRDPPGNSGCPLSGV